ncbi:KpsF/GutQ family sugar-phosphate isomerase [Aliivibrio salmonicida]|uniref:Arabinose 5-phosphate isomerase n=1 Tax=Aliivibrio salmonicida (strain LFI1238) TaxID=316275 RepID=B6EMA7_ALISL|nr:KpsF/GutQ family sugar-phosphate isomerase [Aliivibrio salmonicida]AZL83936.1 KpsF/GutQ family sugar-phosphate isomerase [Aliivibrio salmonicida]CAQ78188.1 arabinose 5-phosphate isomerase [Aliivibrio salmonicida LFI1238]
MATQFDFCKAGKNVLQIEIDALTQLNNYINDDFTKACQLMLECKRKVVIMGMGKSGHIGKKIAATLASTGTPSFFVHPGEASHGDLGMIEKGDVILAISNSGEAAEILALLPVIKRQGITLITMTSKSSSSMANVADVNLLITVPQEACPLALAPTSSTTATLVMGDALAMALLEARGFTSDDFALSHPGGALGRKLLLHLADIMHTDDELPMVTSDALIKTALLEVSEKGLGMTAIVDEDQKVIGIFTDGDLRRLLDNRIDIHTQTIGEVMAHTPSVASPNLLAVEGLNLMQDKKINGLLLCDENNRLVGALNMHDLLKAGVM